MMMLDPNTVQVRSERLGSMKGAYDAIRTQAL